MRAPRLILGILLVPILIFALGETAPAFAQIGGPPAPPSITLAPAPQAPTTPPPGATLQPLATPTPQSALPGLAPAPTVIGATPAPTPSVFRCSCYGIGSGTQWVGTVQASTTLDAQQSAEGQCIGTLASKNPRSPYIPRPGFGFSGSSAFPQVGSDTIPGDVFNPTAGVAVPSGSTTGSTQQLGASLTRQRIYGTRSGMQVCGHCACD